MPSSPSGPNQTNTLVSILGAGKTLMESLGKGFLYLNG